MATYRESGVDLDAADALVDEIKSAVTATWGPGVVGAFGGFAGGIKLPPGYTSPVLMMSTDGVGTKAELARQTGMLDGLGWDLVAMCIDDLVAAGAVPFAMTDYIATGLLDLDRMGRLVTSIAAACGAANVALVGGETAEHPGVMDPDAFDLAGAAVGVVEEGKQIDGSAIAVGDVVIGVASPNLRSNGFSLVRKILDGRDLSSELPGTNASIAEVVLAPSVLYTPAIVDLIAKVPVHGMAHITGGGIVGNLPRILAPDLDAMVDTKRWVPPAVFGSLQQLGDVPDEDMFRTFNMGIGFAIVVAPDAVAETIEILADHHRSAGPIGTISAGTGAAHLT